MSLTCWRRIGASHVNSLVKDSSMMVTSKSQLCHMKSSLNSMCCHRTLYHLCLPTFSTESHLRRNNACVLHQSQYDQRFFKCYGTPSYYRPRRKSPCKSLLKATLPSSLQKMLLFTDSTQAPKKEFSERRIIGFTRDQMFLVVSDIENYSKFLPWCESSVVTARSLTHIQADLVIGMKPVTESYSSRVFLRQPSLIIAESNKGAHFKRMLTKWQFSPGLKTTPASCVVDFYVSFEFISALHASIANVFFNEVAKAMAGAFYEEAKRRYGKESVPSRKIEVVKSDNDKTQF